MIAGRYELSHLPMRGSMGEVFEAYDLRLDRRVAVKRIGDGLVDDAEAAKRFEREARLTARVSHPGVPRVFDFGADEQGHYMVLEFIDGRGLDELIAEVYPLPAAWVAALGAQICAILAHTHATSLIHRDLKPANILLRANGTVVIVDFGVATVVGASRLSTLTAADQVVGSAEYQAPERRLGVESPLTDLYAVGRVLHDLATGTLPGTTFTRSDPAPSVAADMFTLISVLSAARPQDRPQTAKEVVDRLIPLVASLPPLPGFVSHTNAVPSHVRAYAAAAGTVVTGRPHGDPVAVADLAHLRRRAERHANDGRPQQAVEVLDHAIELAEGTGAPILLDLRWDRARRLGEAGDYATAAVHLATVTDEMAHRLTPNHPAVVSARFSRCQAEAACGHVQVALELLQALLIDLRAAYGASDARLHPIRRELGVQLAVAGDAEQAHTVLSELIIEQRRTLDPHDPELVATMDAFASI